MLVRKMAQLHAVSSLPILVNSVPNRSVNQVSWNGTSEYIQVIIPVDFCVNYFMFSVDCHKIVFDVDSCVIVAVFLVCVHKPVKLVLLL